MRAVLVGIVVVLVLCMIVWFLPRALANTAPYTLTAGCVSYEGCGYTTKITLQYDFYGLVIPPSDRFCPKCGKIIFYGSVDGNDLINQLYKRPEDVNEVSQVQDR